MYGQTDVRNADALRDGIRRRGALPVGPTAQLGHFRTYSRRFRATVAAADVLRLTGVIPLDGGIPLIADGKVVGGIGVSGGTGQQDGRVARVGASVVK